jgi:hypothetical protein
VKNILIVMAAQSMPADGYFTGLFLIAAAVVGISALARFVWLKKGLGWGATAGVLIPPWIGILWIMSELLEVTKSQSGTPIGFPIITAGFVIAAFTLHEKEEHGKDPDRES